MKNRSHRLTPVYELAGMNKPQGPDDSPVMDPAQLLYEAEQAGALDAPMYDKHVFLANAESGYLRELEALRRQVTAQHDLRGSRSVQMAEELLARQEEQLAQAESAREAAQRELETADAHVQRTREVLLTPGAFHDPDRLGEAWWATALKMAWVPAVCGVLEVGLNTTVLMVMNASTTETVVMALAVLAAGVLAPFAAGVHARRYRGVHGGRAQLVRWTLPVLLAALLGTVQLFMAALRSAYLNSPQVDPTTGTSELALLATLGIPAAAVFAGWWALQLVLSSVVAWHAEATHNPYVAAHRNATSALRRAHRLLGAASGTERRTQEVVEAAKADRDRVIYQHQAKVRELSGWIDRAGEIYGRAMGRAKADPEFTEAMNRWIAQRPTVVDPPKLHAV